MNKGNQKTEEFPAISIPSDNFTIVSKKADCRAASTVNTASLPFSETDNVLSNKPLRRPKRFIPLRDIQ